MYDAVIIGGGITGLYAAYRLVSETRASVVLLERSARLGGRIQTVYHPDGYHYEAGAGRFAAQHRRLIGLLDHFGLHRSRIPHGTIYRPSGTKPETMDADKIITRLLGAVLRAARGMDASALRSIGFGDLCKQVLGVDEAQILRGAFGYNGEFETINAWDGCRMMRAQRPSTTYYVCREGLSALISRMEQALIDSGRCRIYRETTVGSFDYVPRRHSFTIRATDRTGGDRLYRSRVLIAAIPQKDLITLDKGTFEGAHLGLLQSVEPVSLHRIYGRWDQQQDAWFAAAGIPKTTADSRLRMFIPVSQTNGLAMVSYTDREDADYWKRVADGRGGLERTVLRELGVVFPELPASIPSPEWVKSYYWQEGIHYWRHGVDSTVTSQQVQRLLGQQVPFFVAGEAFSTDQGWMESGLESLDAVLPDITKAIASRGTPI